MYHSVSPPFAKPQIRECSRNSPTIERTRMLLRHALDAGQQRAGAADDQVDCRRRPARPGRAPRSKAGRRARSSSRRSGPRWPALACSISRSTSSRNRVRRLFGATSSRRNVRWRERPVRTLNRSVTSAPIRPAGQQPEVRVQAGGLGVVVAGPDVDVAAQARALAADDRANLRVGLEADEPVDDVGAGVLELAGPDDVRLLVEAGLDLDEDDDLLAASAARIRSRTIGESPEVR